MKVFSSLGQRVGHVCVGHVCVGHVCVGHVCVRALAIVACTLASPAIAQTQPSEQKISVLPSGIHFLPFQTPTNPIVINPVAVPPPAAPVANQPDRPPAVPRVLSKARMAHPNGRFDDWISYADYPVRALREGVSAEVLFRLTIAIDGTPTACETFGKSGSEELDHTTCKVLLKRAHFFPALNDQGKPIASIYSSALHWRAPVIFQAIPPTTTWKLTYDVTQDGIVANCHLETHGYPPTQQAYVNAGASCAGVGLFVPQVDAAGKPAPKHVVIVRTVTVTDAP